MMPQQARAEATFEQARQRVAFLTDNGVLTGVEAERILGRIAERLNARIGGLLLDKRPVQSDV